MRANLWESLPEIMHFGPWPIAKREIFFASSLSFAFTNLKPVLPGHVLVSSRRPVARMQDLTVEEVSDLFTTARIAGTIVTYKFPPSDALTFTVQDGKAAGQTVAHVHVHVIPRHALDKFNTELKNDDIYKELDKKEERVDSSREARTRDDMAAEAEQLRKIAEKLFN
jgi:diadenosine tetraphosphate (Ap4A) HIT family hydrolase